MAGTHVHVCRSGHHPFPHTHLASATFSMTATSRPALVDRGGPPHFSLATSLVNGSRGLSITNNILHNIASPSHNVPHPSRSHPLSPLHTPSPTPFIPSPTPHPHPSSTPPPPHPSSPLLIHTPSPHPSSPLPHLLTCFHPLHLGRVTEHCLSSDAL